MAAKKSKKVARKPAKAPATAGARKAAPRKAGAKPRAAAASSRPARRADFGAPVDGFFKKQPPSLRVILEALRELVESAAPDATASLKWGMPFYSVGGQMMCALGAHKAHVNLVLAGPPQAFPDPEGLLEGSSKNGRHLRLTSIDQLPRAAVGGWLKAAAKHARARG